MSLIGFVLGGMSVLPLLMITSWLLIRSTGAYAVPWCGLIGCTAFASLAFMFEVALRGDRKRAREARDAASGVDTAHKLHSIKSEITPGQGQGQSQGQGRTSNERDTAVQLPLVASASASPQPQVAWSAKERDTGGAATVTVASPSATNMNSTAPVTASST